MRRVFIFLRLAVQSSLTFISGPFLLIAQIRRSAVPQRATTSFRSLTIGLACWVLSSVGAANAAEISHQELGYVDGVEAIFIDGDISSSDTQKFREISIKYKKAVVFLSSNGGELMPALEIGKIIKIAGYMTIVADNTVCASSCALIWTAGSTRGKSTKGRVGFHASYRDNNGKLEESGVANALIGNYLTLLNFSERAIIFATTSAPDKISWLTPQNMASSAIDFEAYDEAAAKAELDAAALKVAAKPYVQVVPIKQTSAVPSPFPENLSNNGGN